MYKGRAVGMRFEPLIVLSQGKKHRVSSAYGIMAIHCVGRKPFREGRP